MIGLVLFVNLCGMRKKKRLKLEFDIFNNSGGRGLTECCILNTALCRRAREMKRGGGSRLCLNILCLTMQQAFTRVLCIHQYPFSPVTSIRRLCREAGALVTDPGGRSFLVTEQDAQGPAAERAEAMRKKGAQGRAGKQSSPLPAGSGSDLHGRG